jgi:hypothetical protein
MITFALCITMGKSLKVGDIPKMLLGICLESLSYSQLFLVVFGWFLLVFFGWLANVHTSVG